MNVHFSRADYSFCIGSTSILSQNKHLYSYIYIIILNNERKGTVFLLLMKFLFVAEVKENILGVENIVQVNFWDFGGQWVYYTTHQSYLSKRCLYLLVFNLAKGLHEHVPEENTHNEASTKTVLGKVPLIQLILLFQ